MTMTVPLVIRRADAVTKTFSSTLWGTLVTVPLDVDNLSCSDVDGVELCPALSEYGNYNGRTSGGIPNSIYSITGQSVLEASPIIGHGCLIDPGIQSCTLNGVTDACEYVVAGGSYATQQSNVGTANIFYGFFNSNPVGTFCVDYSAFPSNFSGTFSGNILGGTGVFAGNTGTFTETITGRYTSVDLQGHNFGWFSGSASGSMTH
jgi:hypothetical protein